MYGLCLPLPGRTRRGTSRSEAPAVESSGCVGRGQGAWICDPSARHRCGAPPRDKQNLRLWPGIVNYGFERTEVGTGKTEGTAVILFRPAVPFKCLIESEAIVAI